MTASYGSLVVAGGGLAGLLAAAAGAACFDDVAVVDSRGADPRAVFGAPQAGHLHNVLTRGQQQLEQLLPGFRERLLTMGAVEGSVADNTHVFEFGGSATERPLGLSIWSAPLPMLWQVARSLLPANVRVLQRSTVEGLVVPGNGGYQVLVRTGAERRHLNADGVVDASGHSALADSLLEAAGLPRPPITERRLDRWFVTIRLQRAPKWHDVPDFWMVFAEPPDRDAALLSPLGCHEWILSVSSQSGRRPPRSFAAICAFLDDLPGPPLRPVIEGATPIASPSYFRRRTARWRHYEAMAADPAAQPIDRFVAIGDAYAALNPVYGQGVGLAAWEASILGDALHDEGCDGSWTPRYLVSAGAVVSDAWGLDDVPVPCISAAEWIRLAGALSENADMQRRYVGLWHLVEPPSTLRDLVAMTSANPAGLEAQE